MPRPTKADEKMLKFLATTENLSMGLSGLGGDIDQYAEDASGSPEHAIALSAAKKDVEKARKELDAAKLCLLAAHGAAQIKPPTEQMHLAKGKTEDD